jgi:hypothetical protein
MPAALPVKQQSLGDPVSTAQGVKLGYPRRQEGREAQRASADQFAANMLPVIEGVKAAVATSFDAIAMALNVRSIGPCPSQIAPLLRILNMVSSAIRRTPNGRNLPPQRRI